MFQNGTLGGLALAAGLWAAAFVGGAVAGETAPAMELGATALPPEGYISFCQRQPWDCGAVQQEVLARADQAAAERAALFAAASTVALSSLPGGEAAAVVAPAVATSQGGAAQRLAAAPAAEPASTAIPVGYTQATPAVAAEPAVAVTQVETPAAFEPLRMTPQLWSKLNRVNDVVNRTIVQATDLATYGKVDYWSTPIEDGVRTGDCEDFVLEKERALLAEGLPREALNIAVVTTPWGETHAVLLVATSEGEQVLDNLSPWVKPWQKTGYRFRERQVGGDPFKWVMVVDPNRPHPQPLGRVIVASVR